jgi:uncharacterized iron-regulated protein
MLNKSTLLGLILLITGCQHFKPEYAITDHELIDKIWSVKAQQFVDPEALQQEILSASILLLGETHDNAIHHQLQAEMIAHLLKHNRKPAVAFEMLNRDQQDEIDQFQKKSSAPNDADSFAHAIDWEQSGWPDWPYYRPVFKIVLKAGLPVIGANLNHKLIRKVIRQGTEVLSPHYQELLAEYAYNDNTRHELEADIFAAHCEMLPKKHLAPMLTAQQLRDISMSQVLLNKQTADGIVLIAGSGHIRNDYGIPFYLDKKAVNKQAQDKEKPGIKILSLAFIEVSENALKAKDYAEEWSREQLPFDYVWFTAKAFREDQCALLKEHMQKKQLKK